MILAVKRLKALGWIVLIFIVLIALYPLSLSVATLRSDLARTEREIVQTKAKIRYLETEYATRASLSQLETWNELGYGYVAPRADQYLEGERALANLGDDDRQMNKPVRVAAVTFAGSDVSPAGNIGSTLSDLQSIDKKPAQTSGKANDKPEQEKKVKVASADTAVSAPIRAPALNDRMLDGLALEATVEQLREKNR